MMAAAKHPSGELRCNESLARYTSWRVGGPARQVYVPADLDDLAAFLAELPAGEPLLWLGLGSNVLIRDGGFDGTVVVTCNALAGLTKQGERRIWAAAGVPGAKVAKFAAKEGLAGAEFFAGIPGTLGGALAMNAGAFGGETWPIVVSVDTIDRHGRRHRRGPDDFQIAYRSVKAEREEWFTGAVLALEPAPAQEVQQRIKALLEKRNRSQPTNQANCGSVFRNPPGDFAARLIEASGLKGLQLGGAVVSQKHANFIVNDGAASAADIERLIEHVAAEVERQHGVRLIREVHIIGAGEHSS